MSYGQEVDKRTDLRETAICQQPARKYAGSGSLGAGPLVYRKHALGAGRQSVAGQDKTQVIEIGPQHWHHTENGTRRILHLERTAQEAFFCTYLPGADKKERTSDLPLSVHTANLFLIIHRSNIRFNFTMSPFKDKDIINIVRIIQIGDHCVFIHYIKFKHAS